MKVDEKSNFKQHLSIFIFLSQKKNNIAKK